MQALAVKEQPNNQKDYYEFPVDEVVESYLTYGFGLTTAIMGNVEKNEVHPFVAAAHYLVQSYWKEKRQIPLEEIIFEFQEDSVEACRYFFDEDAYTEYYDGILMSLINEEIDTVDYLMEFTSPPPTSRLEALLGDDYVAMAERYKEGITVGKTILEKLKANNVIEKW